MTAVTGEQEPSEWGKEFHALDHDEVLGAGSAGPGKTTVLLDDPKFLISIEQSRCLKKSDDHLRIRWGESTCKILHLRREMGMLEETISRAKRIYPRLDKDVHFTEQYGKPTAIFKSGAKIIFGGCKDLGDYAQYDTAEFVRIYYDELRQFEKEQYDAINVRCRSSDPVLSQFLGIRAATNPTSNWVRDYFYDPAPKGRVTLRDKVVSPSTGKVTWKTRIYLPATLYDNPNKAFVEQYEQKLMSAPAHIRNSLLFGNWYTTIGSYYADEWRNDLHVIRPFKIPGHWTRFRSMDWGYKTNGVVLWWAVNEEGDMICEREFTFKLMEPTKVAQRIRDIEKEAGLWDAKRNRSKLMGPADTQIWGSDGQAGGITIAGEMLKVGVHWDKADKGPGSRRKHALALVTRLRDHGDGTTFPGIAWFQDCRMCITTIPGIEADPNDIEEPLKSEKDHHHDATLYAVGYRATPATDMTRNWYEEDEDEEEEREEQKRKRGKLGYGF